MYNNNIESITLKEILTLAFPLTDHHPLILLTLITYSACWHKAKVAGKKDNVVLFVLIFDAFLSDPGIGHIWKRSTAH